MIWLLPDLTSLTMYLGIPKSAAVARLMNALFSLLQWLWCPKDDSRARLSKRIEKNTFAVCVAFVALVSVSRPIVLLLSEVSWASWIWSIPRRQVRRERR